MLIVFTKYHCYSHLPRWCTYPNCIVFQFFALFFNWYTSDINSSNLLLVLLLIGLYLFLMCVCGLIKKLLKPMELKQDRESEPFAQTAQCLRPKRDSAKRNIQNQTAMNVSPNSTFFHIRVCGCRQPRAHGLNSNNQTKKCCIRLVFFNMFVMMKIC